VSRSPKGKSKMCSLKQYRKRLALKLVMLASRSRVPTTTNFVIRRQKCQHEPREHREPEIAGSTGVQAVARICWLIAETAL
jgi:hypothetical protein